MPDFPRESKQGSDRLRNTEERVFVPIQYRCPDTPQERSVCCQNLARCTFGCGNLGTLDGGEVSQPGVVL